MIVVGTCRICGCRDDQTCELETGDACHWLDRDRTALLESAVCRARAARRAGAARRLPRPGRELLESRRRDPLSRRAAADRDAVKSFPDDIYRGAGDRLVRLVEQIERGSFTLRVWENLVSHRRAYFLYGPDGTALINGHMVDWNPAGAAQHSPGRIA